MKKFLRFGLKTGLLACLITLLVSGSALALHIVSLDASRTGDENESGGDRYLTSAAMANATNVLLAAGFTIGTTSSFTTANIAGACALYTGAVNTAFSAQELADIAAFVAAGGGLVIQRDWGDFYPAADPLAALFGVTYSTAAVGSAGTAAAVNKTVDHPIWSGPAGAVTTYDQVYSSSVSGATIIGVHAANGSTALAVQIYGLGHVVYLTDMDAWDDFGDPVSPTAGSNNAIVWENIFHYACTPVPAPSTVLLLGTGLLGLPFLRKRWKR